MVITNHSITIFFTCSKEGISVEGVIIWETFYKTGKSEIAAIPGNGPQKQCSNKMYFIVLDYVLQVHHKHYPLGSEQRKTCPLLQRFWFKLLCDGAQAPSIFIAPLVILKCTWAWELLLPRLQVSQRQNIHSPHTASQTSVGNGWTPSQ